MNNKPNQVLGRTCPICLNRSDIRDLPQGWNCNSCLHVWRREPWKDIGTIEHFNNATYTKPESPKTLNTHTRLFELFEQIASAANHGKNGLMVDFGCSCGACMEIFKKKNWDVFGIEIAPSSQKVLTSKNLRWALLQQSSLKYGSVDTIIAADCIYYLPDPVETLSEMRKYLTPQGILILRQPTRAGLMRLISRLPCTSKITQLIWCDHIHLFSRHSTVSALARAGFLRIDILKERGFARKFVNQAAHQILHCLDLITFRFFDLTPSWTVCAKLYPPLNRMWFMLQGERINLRRIKILDIPDIFKAIMEPEVAEGAVPFKTSITKNPFLHLLRRVPRYAGKTIRYLYWKLFPPKNRKIFRFGISLKQSGKIVGMAILTRRGLQFEYGEVGFWIIKEYWGKGLMTEALKMVVDFGFKHLALEKIEGWTMKENIASQRVMEKCGFKICNQEDVRNTKSPPKSGYLYRILNSEYHGDYGNLIPEKVYAE